MRNMSFSLTTPAVRDQTKNVTRRLGWDFLCNYDNLMAVEKCQGIKKGELKRIGVIIVLPFRWEPLNDIVRFPVRDDQPHTIRRPKRSEVAREGFPDITPEEFVEMFLKAHKGKKINGEPIGPETPVNRIPFRYRDVIPL